MTADYSTGEIKLKLALSSEKNVSIDFIVNEATQMWRDVRGRKIKFGDADAAENLMQCMQREHPEFCKSYPIVNRYMCQMQEFDKKTFKHWLMKIKNHPWLTEDGYIDAQVDYVTMLFKARKPRANTTEISNIRTNIRAILQREHAMFKHYAQEFNNEVTAEETNLRARNADELYKFAQIAGVVGLSKAETTRVESDLAASTTATGVDELVANITSDTVIDFSADDLLAS